MPLQLRMGILAVIGLAAGAMVNHMIYTWCWFPRPISPWAKPDDNAPPRQSSDRIPLIGWLGLRREREIHGGGFWVRPILIEVGLAIALPLLYQYETLAAKILPPGLSPQDIAAFEPWGTQLFFAHAFLLVLMVAATFIDFDEQTIPDAITVPGTLIALILASCSLKFFMPVVGVNEANQPSLMPITFEHPWLPVSAKWFKSTGLCTGLAIWSGWCFALADRRVILRKGYAKAIEFFFAGLVRHPTWKLLGGIWLVGVLGIFLVYWLGEPYWWGLFSSLVGLAIGGGVIWAIRIVGSVSMRVEAMGFGDVTLMAMIGAFLGWQASLIAFIIAPFTSLVIALVQFAFTRNRAIPFGPYLCAGTLLTMLYWPTVWPKLAMNLDLFGPFLLWFGAAMLGLMGVMLFVWRIVKETFIYRD